MHEPATLLTEEAEGALARRGFLLDRAALRRLTERRTALIHERDTLRAQLKALSRRRGAGDTADGGEAGAVALKERLRKLDDEHRRCDEELHRLLLEVPNLPAPEAPDGSATDEPVVARTWPAPGVEPEAEEATDTWALDHVALGARMGILDPRRAAKLSGARFAVTRGTGARLERALASYLLDLHTTRHGYVEHGVPHLVTPETMTGTGQLPKFAEDLFHTSVAGRELLLIPTAEVPLVNLYRDEVLAPKELPLALVARTPCYRAEAGSYGRDTQGLIRLHQFDKVELVRLCHPQAAAAELDLLVSHVEAALRGLRLRYRVVELRAGDLGFAARRTFDLEVWLPGQRAWREISSCSECGAFQSRRAGIRIGGGAGRKVPPATLNGSGLPIGRTLVAVLEQHQRPDGSVVLPPALVPYAGFRAIAPDGAAVP